MTTRAVTIRSKSGANPCTNNSSNMAVSSAPALSTLPSKPTSKKSNKPKASQPRSAGSSNGKKPRSNNSRNQSSSSSPSSSSISSSSVSSISISISNVKGGAANGHPIQAPPQRASASASASAPATPQQRRTVMPVKVRRMERRKDIVSMTDALQSAQVDLLSSSPPTSSAESEDSDAQNKRKSHNNNNNNKRQNANQHRRSPQQPPAPSAFPPLQKKSTGLRSRRRSSSAVDVRSQVYAGPTFSNAPAPSALPIPAFTSPEPARHRTVSLNLNLQPSVALPSYSSVVVREEDEDDEENYYHPHQQQQNHHHHHQQQQQQQQQQHHSQHSQHSIFSMDPLPHLQQQSIELMNLLTPTLPRNAFPARLRTSHDFNTDQMLSEIQRGLRSMLKIEA
ncbi:hypothetical protein F4703DRAFT_1848123 [Phycomyces blakesleeanus]